MRLFTIALAAAFVGTLGLSEAEANRRDRRGDRGHRHGHRHDRGHRHHRDHHHRHRDHHYRYRPRPVYPYPGYNSGWHYHDSYYYGSASCTPEVKQKNVEILENTVKGLLATSEFNNAKVLRDSVAAIQSSKDVDSRIVAYTSLLGVDANNPSEIAEFIGARDLGPYVAVAQEQLDLTDKQADLLVKTISENLLSGLNN